MRRYGHAVLGGTFDRLHVGHAALLSAAFRAGRRVSIGLTTDAFVRAEGKPMGQRLQPYATRRRVLARWIRGRFPGRSVRIVPLANRFGRSVEDGVDVLVVSAETEAGGRAVNAERRRRGRRPVPILAVPLVLADDLRPVSSRRIRAGEIDRWGRRRSPLHIGLVVSDDIRTSARAAVRRAFPRARITVLSSSRPRSRGAPSRQAARSAASAVAGRDLGIAVLRRPAGGWVMAERSPEIALDAVNLPPSPASRLTRALADRWAPARPQAL